MWLRANHKLRKKGGAPQTHSIDCPVLYLSSFCLSFRSLLNFALSTFYHNNAPNPFFSSVSLFTGGAEMAAEMERKREQKGRRVTEESEHTLQPNKGQMSIGYRSVSLPRVPSSKGVTQVLNMATISRFGCLKGLLFSSPRYGVSNPENFPIQHLFDVGRQQIAYVSLHFRLTITIATPIVRYRGFVSLQYFCMKYRKHSFLLLSSIFCCKNKEFCHMMC
uniref:Uncharacterized protein n=1 Tax=Cucumis sativus TaxID=3659 RepID=A0A0A0LW76_CUCSA